jgi:hypothetical protein
MCKSINGKELTLPQILERLEARKHSRILAASKEAERSVTYSRQEIVSARTVLDRLLNVPRTRSYVVHHTKIRI